MDLAWWNALGWFTALVVMVVTTVQGILFDRRQKRQMAEVAEDIGFAMARDTKAKVQRDDARQHLQAIQTVALSGLESRNHPYRGFDRWTKTLEDISELARLGLKQSEE